MVNESDLNVSVVVLAYNEELKIAACLESLLNQTEPASEIVVVNNNSSDRTVEIAKRYPVTVVDEPKQGFIPARRRGFDTAKGPIIARIDVDGTVGRDWIKTIKESFRDTKKPMVALTGPVQYDDMPIIKHMTFPYPGNGFYMWLVGMWPTLVGPNMVITKAIWLKIRDEVHNDDKQVHEDMDLSIHIRRYGRIAFNRKLLVYTSARRLVKRPGSFFFEYPWRNFKTVAIHWSRKR